MWLVAALYCLVVCLKGRDAATNDRTNVDHRNENLVPAGSAAAIDRRRLPLAAKVFGVLCVVVGVAVTALLALVIVDAIREVQKSGLQTQMSNVALVISVVQSVLLVASAVLSVFLGVRLLTNRRRFAAQTAEALLFVVVAAAICEVMDNGIHGSLISYGVTVVFLIALQSYLDPSLAEERELQRKLREMDVRDEAEEGTLGLDPSGKGYITLNFFNLFWIFVVCSVIGLVAEIAYHMVVVDPGHYEDRAGLLFGPFSPIYGFGGVLMTMALNRYYRSNVVVVFLVSAVIGGAFEYFVSWFMQFAFGIVAWDYTGTFLSIGGRTNAYFMAMWGLMGVFWIKLALPVMLKIVNLIPWNWRYALTSVAAAFMIADCAFTLVALDCWYMREAGIPQDTAIQVFFDEHFDDKFMEHRFQSMSIDPGSATRAR